MHECQHQETGACEGCRHPLAPRPFKYAKGLTPHEPFKVLEALLNLPANSQGQFVGTFPKFTVTWEML